jgi:cytochrome c biogenesis protein
VATDTVLRAGAVAAFDPLRWLFRLLTSVRFALLLIGLLALASLAGVLLPQVPSQMRGDPSAEAAWVDFQEGKFGILTDLMHRLGLFTLFRSTWFVALLAALVVSLCVCTMSRLAPIWRNVTRPYTRVPDDFFGRGQPVIALATPEVGALASELERRRYKVRLEPEGASTYLFADRFPWSQLATFVSHLALILFVAGGFVTVVSSREEQVFIGELTSAPVFSPADSDHMQVYVQDAVGEFDPTGFPLDYRTEMVVYHHGREVARGVSTVNDPLRYNGYSFHQSAYFPDGAALKVRDIATGRTVYDEVLALTTFAATPHIVVRDAAGNVVLDDTIIPTDFLQGVVGSTLVIPGTETALWVGARGVEETGAWQLAVLETQGDAARGVLEEGGRMQIGDFTLTFVGVRAVPSTLAEDLPGSDAGAVVELSQGPAGKVLTVAPVQGRSLVLADGDSVTVGGLEYIFEGPREFAGITVRRDPGSTFIWVGTGLLLLGLALTFYVPRRRLWGKISEGQGVFRGLGGRFSAIERELTQASEKAQRPQSS